MVTRQFEKSICTFARLKATKLEGCWLQGRGWAHHCLSRHRLLVVTFFYWRFLVYFISLENSTLKGRYPDRIQIFAFERKKKIDFKRNLIDGNSIRKCVWVRKRFFMIWSEKGIWCCSCHGERKFGKFLVVYTWRAPLQKRLEWWNSKFAPTFLTDNGTKAYLLFFLQWVIHYLFIFPQYLESAKRVNRV